jgi:preprotein translocase SecF subunit
LKRDINFLKFRFPAIGLSVAIFAVFMTLTMMRGGFNMGVDFAGGVKIIAKFDAGVNENDIRGILSEINPTVQQIGEPELNEYNISTKAAPTDAGNKENFRVIKEKLTAKYPTVKFLSEESVGPAIGDVFKRSAVKLFLLAILLMALYLVFRFEMKYAVGCMVALLHDEALAIAFIGFAGIEVNIPIVAALLTIFGFSVNDTIVIFDRVRENIQLMSKQDAAKLTSFEIINRSVTQTLSRTLLTNLTVFFTVGAIYFFGGEVLNDFAKVMLFGLVVGTYSTVYIASPALLFWEKLRAKK